MLRKNEISMYALEKMAENIFGSPCHMSLHLMTIIRGTMKRTMKDDRQEGEKCLTLRSKSLETPFTVSFVQETS